MAGAAAAAGIAGGGSIGALVARAIGREQAVQIESAIAAGGVILWVRVRSLERNVCRD